MKKYILGAIALLLASTGTIYLSKLFGEGTTFFLNFLGFHPVEWVIYAIIVAFILLVLLIIGLIGGFKYFK